MSSSRQRPVLKAPSTGPPEPAFFLTPLGIVEMGSMEPAMLGAAVTGEPMRRRQTGFTKAVLKAAAKEAGR